MIEQFGNATYMRFDPPHKIADLARFALDLPEVGWSEEDGDKETITQNVTELLTDKDRANMLDEYFSLEINDNGELVSIPLLLEGFVVNLKDKKSFNHIIVSL